MDDKEKFTEEEIERMRKYQEHLDKLEEVAKKKREIAALLGFGNALSDDESIQ